MACLSDRVKRGTSCNYFPIQVIGGIAVLQGPNIVTKTGSVSFTVPHVSPVFIISVLESAGREPRVCFYSTVISSHHRLPGTHPPQDMQGYPPIVACRLGCRILAMSNFCVLL